MARPKTQKLYCYVDETGQDTLGRLFIVAVVMTDNRRDELAAQLELAEHQSGKHKRKWLKTRSIEAQAYFDILISQGIAGRAYTQAFEDTSRSYENLEVLAASKAINLYANKGNFSDAYKVTIAIDGLPKNLRPRIGRDFRLLGIKIRNVHGERDGSSSIIRLADAVAGLVRDAGEGKPEYVALQEKLRAAHILYLL